ncbi:MBL fold metallo-hydrolase [Shewanella sp. NIFS-20-20]|uniref:MBL fold metallo-hydrolase n=1 Tax=Shewanella sp. NIFS-20-20 TaxID=2853806 RepID=UPI001C43B5F8|nr:MBL fold metallo-hydrolase [Shewanella sp. NIFS-20-20]MBV7316818.1 MBL fold metallo-hydrolase [Shewanella sp. NIFS-20-20]
MKTELIVETPTHKWLYFGRDHEKNEKIIDTNQYLVQSGSQSLLMDPGGIELFAPMLASLVRQLPIEHITYLFASHQDPDIISSLGLWDQTLPKAKLYSPWLWESFIRHFGMNNIKFEPIDDEGGKLLVGDVELHFIPAHYLHSSGNFHVYDPVGKVLMSGDVGAALEDNNADIYVDDFAKHSQKMQFFHQRWMPSNRAKDNWIARVRSLDIEYMCPQHGRIFRGDQVKQFLDWFAALNVGITN